MVTINNDQELYVIPCGRGFTCFGFKNLEVKATRMQDWLNANGWATFIHLSGKIGTPERYESYLVMCAAVESIVKSSGRRCPVELSPQLSGLEGHRVEVVDTWGERRRFQVGKSTGWMPCHLEVHNCRCVGGPAAEREYKSVRIVR